MALDTSGLDAGNVVYVGDARWDGVTTGRAGITFVGVLSGGIPEAHLRDAGAVEIYADARELVEKFDSSALGRLAARGRSSG